MRLEWRVRLDAILMGSDHAYARMLQCADAIVKKARPIMLGTVVQTLTFAEYHLMYCALWSRQNKMHNVSLPAYGPCNKAMGPAARMTARRGLDGLTEPKLAFRRTPFGNVPLQTDHHLSCMEYHQCNERVGGILARSCQAWGSQYSHAFARFDNLIHITT